MISKLWGAVAVAIVAVAACGGGDSSTAATTGMNASGGGGASSGAAGGSSEAGGSGGTTTTTTADGGGGGSAGGCPDPKQCGAPPQCAPLVTPQEIAEAPPTPTNGSVADGTYFLTAYNVYTGPGGPSGPGMGQVGYTFELSSGAFKESVTTVDSSGTHLSAASGTAIFAPGATQNFNQHCPIAATLDASYSVDADGTLHVFVTLGGATIESVFAPQP